MTIHSPQLTQRILKWFNSESPDDAKGTYRVQLAPDGLRLRWIALLGGRHVEPYDDEPEVDHLLRLKLFLMSVFVSEDLL